MLAAYQPPAPTRGNIVMRHERIIERQDSGCGRVSIFRLFEASRPLVVIPRVPAHSASPHFLPHSTLATVARSVQRTRHNDQYSTRKREGRTPQLVVNNHCDRKSAPQRVNNHLPGC